MNSCNSHNTYHIPRASLQTAVEVFKVGVENGQYKLPNVPPQQNKAREREEVRVDAVHYGSSSS